MNTADPIDPAAIARLERLGGAGFVREMIDLFLGYAPGKIAAAETALAEGNFSALEHAVHPLKSGSGNVGATALGELAKNAELAARNKDTQALPQLVAALAPAFAAATARLQIIRQQLPS